MENLIKLKDNIPLSELITRTLTDTGYTDTLTAEDTIENKTRLENLDEFMSAAEEFMKNKEYSGKLSEFLESVTLVADVDAYDEEQDAAVLMTIHSSKGLEFPNVFIAGMEDGIFPGIRSIESGQEEIDEERRLCYVAMTRAKEKLYITKTQSRTFYGKKAPSRESRFFREIPAEYIEDVSGVTVKAASLFQRPQIKEQVSGIAAKTAETISADFKPGDIVEHRKFGRGTVISAKQFGKDAILNIQFESIGQKQLMAAFAKLKKIK